MAVIRTLIVDDQAIVRSTLRAVLEQDGRFDIVGEAAEPAGAIRGSAIEPAPGLALVDVHLEEHDGIALARELRRRHPAMVIVLVSTIDVADLPRDALVDGADAFVSKGQLTPERIVEVIRAVPGRGCLAS